MNSILKYSLMLAVWQMSFQKINGKSITSSSSLKSASASSTEVPASSESDRIITTVTKSHLPPIMIEENVKTNDARVRRNSYNNENSYSNNNNNFDDDDFLINQLSREYDIMTSNLMDSTATCNK